VEALDCFERYSVAAIDISHADFEIGRLPTLEEPMKTEIGMVHSIGEAFGRSCYPFLLD
jgi:hypothetical protein